MTRCCRSRRSISAHVSAPLDFFFVFGHVTLHACTRTPVLWEHSLRQGQETTRRSATHLGWERHGITLAGTCPETSEVVHQVCLASSAAMAAIPCSSSVSERATLRIGHSQGQCNVGGNLAPKQQDRRPWSCCIGCCCQGASWNHFFGDRLHRVCSFSLDL